MLLAFVFLLSGRIDISLIDCRVIPLAQFKKFELFLTFHQRMLYWIKCWLKELHLQCIGMIVLESTAVSCSHCAWPHEQSCCVNIQRTLKSDSCSFRIWSQSFWQQQCYCCCYWCPVLTFILGQIFWNSKGGVISLCTMHKWWSITRCEWESCWCWKKYDYFKTSVMANWIVAWQCINRIADWHCFFIKFVQSTFQSYTKLILSLVFNDNVKFQSYVEVLRYSAGVPRARSAF